MRRQSRSRRFRSRDCGKSGAHSLRSPDIGGLLFTIDPARTEQLEDRFAAAELPLWAIGTVTEGTGVTVVV